MPLPQIRPQTTKNEILSWYNETVQAIERWKVAQTESVSYRRINVLKNMEELKEIIEVARTENITTAMAWASDHNKTLALLYSETQFFYVENGSAHPINVSPAHAIQIRNTLDSEISSATNTLSLEQYKIIMPLLTERSDLTPINIIVDYFQKTARWYYDIFSFYVGLMHHQDAISKAIKNNDDALSHNYLSKVITPLQGLLNVDLFTLMDDNNHYPAMFDALRTLSNNHSYRAQLERCVRFPSIAGPTLDILFSEAPSVFKYSDIFDNDVIHENRNSFVEYYALVAKHVTGAIIHCDNARDALKQVLHNFSGDETKDEIEKAMRCIKNTRAEHKTLGSRFAADATIINLSNEVIKRPDTILRVIAGSLFTSATDQSLHAMTTPADLLRSLLPRILPSAFRPKEEILLLNQRYNNIHSFSEEQKQLFHKAFGLNEGTIDPTSSWQPLDLTQMNPAGLKALADTEQLYSHIWLSLALIAPLNDTFTFKERADVYDEFYKTYGGNNSALLSDILELIYTEGAQLGKTLEDLKNYTPRGVTIDNPARMKAELSYYKTLAAIRASQLADLESELIVVTKQNKTMRAAHTIWNAAKKTKAQETINVLKTTNDQLQEQIQRLEQQNQFSAGSSRESYMPKDEEPCTQTDSSRKKGVPWCKDSDDAHSLKEIQKSFLAYFSEVTNSTGINILKEKITQNKYNSVDDFARAIKEIAKEREYNAWSTLSLCSFFKPGRHEKVTLLYSMLNSTRNSTTCLKEFMAKVEEEFMTTSEGQTLRVSQSSPLSLGGNGADY